MFAPTRILAPVDFSDASDTALRRAADLARRTGAELHVLHVIPGVSPDTAFHALSEEDQDFYRQLLADAERQLSERFAWLDEENVRAKRVISKGAPSHILLDYARREGVDLVVMGTHGRRGVRRFLLGSVAGEVLRQTDIATLVVPMAAGTGAIRHVLAPTDFSEQAGWALPVAAGLAALYHASLTLAHVVEPIPYVETMAGAEFTLQLLPEMRSQAAEQLEYLATEGPAADAYTDGTDEPVEGNAAAMTLIRGLVLSGRAAEEITDAAAERQVGAIVMSKRGLHGVERFLVGSVTERVCRLAPCAVLVLPIDDEDE